MKLSKIAILALKGSETMKPAIAKELKVALGTVYRWINENELNNNLTKPSVVEIIKKETGLDESAILEREPEKVEVTPN